MSKTTQWILRAVLFTGAIVCLWVVTIAQTGSVHAVQQGQSGLTLEWVGGAPPRFMCVGDSVETMFVIRFVPDPDLAPLAPLVPLGKPIPVPPPAGGSLDVTATQGTVSPSHWTLDFRTGSPMAASFTYTAKTPGLEDLTLTYHYNDSVNTYTGSTPPARIRVQKCDYRVKLKLQQTGTLHVRDVVATPQQWTITGDGGFRIRSDEHNGRGNVPFFGRGVTEIILQGQVYGPRGQGSIMPLTGQGTLQILGETLPDGTLDMSFIVFDIALADAVIIGDGVSVTVPVPKWTTPATCLDSMKFPPEGGTQSCSGPGHRSASPDVVTYTISVEVTVSRED